MFYYTISRHVTSWPDIILVSEKQWSGEEFDRLLRSAYLDALRQVGQKPLEDFDRLLPEHALEYLGKRGFSVCEPMVRTHEETGWAFLSNCWFDLARVEELLSKYPGKWLVVAKDPGRSDNILGGMDVLATEESYEKARTRLAELKSEAVATAGFGDRSPMLGVIKVPAPESFYIPPVEKP
jgi:hypothetical protein